MVRWWLTLEGIPKNMTRVVAYCLRKNSTLNIDKQKGLNTISRFEYVCLSWCFIYPSQQFFNHIRIFYCVQRALSREDKVICSRTQLHSASGEAQTWDGLIKLNILQLRHCAPPNVFVVILHCCCHFKPSL